MKKERLKEENIEELLDMSQKTSRISLAKKNKKRRYGIIIMFLLVIVAGVIFLLTPTIKLKGKENIILEYPNKYKEKGVISKIINKDITSKVKISGKVNSKKIGKYEITYTAQNGFLKQKVTRKVTILDQEKPIITLKGEKTAKVCPNKKYQEDGYEAIDNYDKDITDKVSVKKEKEKWTYTVSDSSGNEAKKVRKLVYIDEELPKIEIVNPTMYIVVGSSYTDPGYKATDNCDGDLTDKIKIDGSVDANKIGKYEVTYTVEDSSGNKAEAKRTVNVQAKTTSSMSCGAPGTIYLTFDDGPQNGSTTKILDVLKEENVKATFFVTMAGPDSLILREYNEGHAIALHTASHEYSYVYSSMDNYFADLQKVSDRVKSITGVESKIIRFPGGSSNTISRRYQSGIMSALTTEVLNRGYRYYDWNVDSDDAGRCASVATSSCVYNNVVKYLSKSSCNMVLMHDIKSYTANALSDIIKYGKANGFTFEKIDMNTPMVRQRVNN